MTISTTASRISYDGNGITTVFSYPYRFLTNADIVVVGVSAAGVETTKTLTTDYTLTGAGDDAGGSCTMLVAPTSGTKLVIYRDTDIVQETDYISGDPFPAETHERALDRLTMIAQEIGSDADRAIKVPVGDSSALTTTLPAAANRLDKFLVFDSTTGATELSTVTQTQVASAVATAYAAGSSTADAVTFIAPGSGATSRSVQSWIRERSVSIVDYGGAPGSGDNTAAMERAAVYLNSIGGGTIVIPYPAEWRMNWVCLTDNIVVEGPGGAGEYDLLCVRPYSILSPAIQFGDGTSVVRYCGMKRVHISGTDSTSGAVYDYTLNAPECFKLAGGVVNFHAYECVFYNGLQTVALTPSASQPVTSNTFVDCTIRNDLNTSANARGIYEIRYADPGYNTANKFDRLKLNGPAVGFAAEIDGRVAGITFEVSNSYWDITPAKGVWLRGVAQFVGFGTQLDPGTTGAIVIETDGDGDIARFIVGYHRNGGQLFKTPSYTYTIPGEADTFAYRARMNEVFLGGSMYFTLPPAPYATTSYLSFDGTNMLVGGMHTLPTVNNTYNLGSSAYKWASVFTTNLTFGDDVSVLTSGAGSPEGVVTASPGSLYTSRSGGAGTTLYVKESGTGNTGWVAK